MTELPSESSAKNWGKWSKWSKWSFKETCNIESEMESKTNW